MQKANKTCKKEQKKIPFRSLCPILRTLSVIKNYKNLIYRTLGLNKRLYIITCSEAKTFVYH